MKLKRKPQLRLPLALLFSFILIFAGLPVSSSAIAPQDSSVNETSQGTETFTQPPNVVADLKE